jgi:hypothetical protein
VERAETSPNVAKRDEGTTLHETFRDEPRCQKPDPDEALRDAIRAALDAGDLDRVTALVELLRSSPRPARVIELARIRKR